jgi:hypothetical protein
MFQFQFKSSLQDHTAKSSVVLFSSLFFVFHQLLFLSLLFLSFLFKRGGEGRKGKERKGEERRGKERKVRILPCF